jgi:hypothetical protein
MSDAVTRRRLCFDPHPVTRFPRAGLYTVWAHFQRGGWGITVPFVVRVATGKPS